MMTSKDLSLLALVIALLFLFLINDVKDNHGVLNSKKFKYKGKEYRIWKKIKGEQRVRPVGEEYNNDEATERKKIIVKNYNVGFWSSTVNVNGETIIVGWGPVKHLAFWGSIVFLLAVIVYFIRCHLIKMNKARWKKFRKEAKKNRDS